MLGRPGERFLLLGMLVYNKEGKLCLEDADGSVQLDLSKLASLPHLTLVVCSYCIGCTRGWDLYGRFFCVGGGRIQ